MIPPAGPGPLRGINFDLGDTLVVEEAGKHLWEMAARPLPGALEVLSWLTGRYRLGVISNTVGSGDAEVAHTLERVGLRRFFDAIVTSRDFGRAKPDPAIFAEAAHRLGLPLEQTCMIGDRLETDVAGALNAGIAGIWLRHPQAAPVPGIEPTHTIRHLHDLLDWLEAPPYTERRTHGP